MDPQQRIQFESTVEALENGKLTYPFIDPISLAQSVAGIPLANIRGSDTSVYVSVFNRDYDEMLFQDTDHVSMYHITGNGEAMLSNHISYTLDSRGPSITLDTGCYRALVALHQACQGLRAGESKMAGVGGVNLILSPDMMIPMSMLGFVEEI